METLSPTPEFLKQFRYEGPQLNQRVARPAGRKKSYWELLPRLETEHRQAIARLEQAYFGAQGHDTRDLNERVDCSNDDYEFWSFRCAMELERAKKSVNSPRAWKALICQMDETLTPQQIGEQWAGIAGRQGAKAWGEGLIEGALENLIMHWGLISKPP